MWFVAMFTAFVMVSCYKKPVDAMDADWVQVTSDEEV